MISQLTNQRLICFTIALFINAVLLKPGLCEINDEESNPDIDSDDVTEKLGGSESYPQITITPKNKTSLKDTYLYQKLNATVGNIMCCLGNIKVSY